MNKSFSRHITGTSLCLALAVFSPSGLRAAPTAVQSDTQHGFTISLDGITSGPDGTRLHVSLANHSSEIIYFYESNTEIWQERKKYEPVRTWENLSALPNRYLPGAQAAGVILFPPLDPGDSPVLVRFQSPANANNSASWSPVEFSRSLPFPVEADEPPAITPPPPAAPRIAIIRADDMTGRTPGWDRFLSASRQLGVKVAIGIICDSLQTDHDGYFAWLRSLQQSGEVEFWNHGFDHQKLPSDSLHTISEFRGSGYTYQRKHFTTAQALMLKVLRRPCVALGTPWNDFDRDTIRVVNEDSNLRLFFAHQTGLFDDHTAVMRIFAIPTDGGTGRPDFAKFKAFYDAHQTRLGAVAFQFHPRNYDAHYQTEYERIITYLRQREWIFLQPREYLAWLKMHPAS